jgi:plasmid segregation protein ParM
MLLVDENNSEFFTLTYWEREVNAKPLVVRAVDVGYGNVKFVTRHIHGQEVLCSLFPSVAPQSSGGQDLGAGLLQKLNTVIVEVNGIRYEVGKDAEHAQDVNHGRVLDRSYPETDTYMALLLGALYYMGESELDCLVLGLPVNTLDEYKGFLEQKVPGVHSVPNINKNVNVRAEPTLKVNVKSVIVYPQPLGALFDYAIRKKLFAEMRAQTNLIVDVGYFTVDWLLAKGIQPAKARSGAQSGGMSAVLSSIGEVIGREHKTQFTSFSRLDDAIRTNSKLTLFGKACDITPFIKFGKVKAREFIATMTNKVGDGSDIDNIILSGGGASFFMDVVQEKFPKHTIVIANDPVFANVRGFQLAGEERLKSERVKAGR